MIKRLAVLLIALLFASPSYAAEAVPTVHSTAYESGHILTTSVSKSLYWITVTWKTQAQRWLIVYDSTTMPDDGALTGSKVLYCAVVSLLNDPNQGSKSFDWTNHPLYRGSSGMVAIISTNGNGCTTKTADGNNVWITAGVN